MTDLRERALARIVAANPPAWVLDHVRAVEDLAVKFCDLAEHQGLRPRRDLVRAGALLHDLGRSVTQDIRHATVGAALLRGDAPAWDGRVVAIVERHTGAGIPKEEASALGLPPKDYLPRSLEERIVAHADNLHSGAQRITMAQLREKYLAKGLPHAWARIEALHASLGRELGADLD